MRLQRSSFLNADECSFLDDSTVACTQETFEDGPPKSFLSGQIHHCDIIRRKCLHERSLGSPWPELSSMDEHAAKSSFGYLSYHIGQSFEKINQNTEPEKQIAIVDASVMSLRFLKVSASAIWRRQMWLSLPSPKKTCLASTF